ncbi:MAG TPA: hypothetical protein VGO48_02905 [Conexibacter sp.]|jgi:hypothetical protein|nr:hypothetical protein [Conexibacter sp.]
MSTEVADLRRGGDKGWRTSLTNLILGINLGGVLLLWLCAMFATLVLVITDAQDVIMGLTFGGIGALAFIAVPRWSFLRWGGDGVERYWERHEMELRKMQFRQAGDISSDIGDYLEEHSTEVTEFLRKRSR